YLVMSDLEMDRARDQADVDTVLSYSEYSRKLQSEGGPTASVEEVIVAVFGDLGISQVAVPSSFPLGIADKLRVSGIQVIPQPDPFWSDREFKSDEEVRSIRKSLEAAEKGIEAGIETLRRTVIQKNGTLLLEGTPLTSEILKRVINTTIMSLGYVPSHSIVASGE